MPRDGKASDVDLDALARLETGGRLPAHHVREAGRHPAVHDRGHAALAGERVERERVLRHEADVHDVAARLDHRAHGLEADEAGEGADHEIVARHEPSDSVGAAEVGANLADAGPLRDPLERLGPQVRDVHPQPRVVGEVPRDRSAHHACAQDHDPLHAVAHPTLRPVIPRSTGRATFVRPSRPCQTGETPGAFW